MAPGDRWRCSVVCGVLVVVNAIAPHAKSAEDLVGYNRDIRPLLSDRCFQCHGPDESTREAGLRLDTREAATAESDSGFIAIVPGSVSESELIARITSDDPDLRMPPADSPKTLDDDEIALLTRWVAQGAAYEPHWAFVPPKRDPSLQVEPHNAIDHFVRAKLQQHGLAPAPPADPVTLLRRVTVDLTGLPPTREEVTSYLADESPDAYERVVDRLLASPRYGEHMARFWLDAVRYGDTHGLHLDNYREMWPYRDWVVRAFNANLPWDEFTVMQIAGDLKADATLDDQIASGFNRCLVTTNEGGSIAEEVYVRNVVDRVSTTGTVFLGLTMGCAVCHDHKFDPITMEDFYSSFAFFNNIDGDPMDGNTADHAPAIKAPTTEQATRLASLHKAIADAEAKIAAPWPDVDRTQKAWEQAVLEKTREANVSPVKFGTWHSVGPFTGDRRYLYGRQHGPEGKPFDPQDQFEIATGERIAWQPQVGWVDGQVHYDLSQKTSATFLYRTIESDRARTVRIGLGTDDGVKVYLNDKLIHQSKQARSVTPEEEKLELQLKQGRNELLLKVVNEGGPSGFCFTLPEASGLPADMLSLVGLPAERRNQEQSAQLQEYYRKQVCEISEVIQLVEEIASLSLEIQQLEGEIPTTLVMKERAEPRPAYLLERGQYDAPDKQRGPLERAVPSFLPPLPDDAPSDRMGYAQWLVADEQPLMARVTVNRFWQQCFGSGIVETSDDFGSQGTWPSHPELLDWLTIDFREHGWDVKRLMKQLVMSATYRQSSKTTAKLQSIDPKNRLLARGPRYRLDAEVVRDQALAVSGLLVNKLGGPGVKPPQPAGLWEAVAYSGSNTRFFVADTGPDKVHRRSLYTFWKRTSPPPQMTTLDAPSRESCVIRRERTNTPLAALMLLNDPQYVEAARALAQRSIHAAAGTPREVATTMFELATLREPEPHEVERLLALFETSLARYQTDPTAANQLVEVGEAPISDQLPHIDVAAWTLVANAVLNFDEVLNKE